MNHALCRKKKIKYKKEKGQKENMVSIFGRDILKTSNLDIKIND